MAVAVCWAGALIADIGFTDTAVSKGVVGLVFWIPATVIGVLGIRQLHTRSAMVRAGLYLLALSVPTFVLARWIITLV